jgi:hypothetical protein
MRFLRSFGLLVSAWDSQNMKCYMSVARVILGGLLVVGSASRSFAAEKATDSPRPLKVGQYNPAHNSVELFEAMKDGRLEVRMIPKDVAGGNVLITNKSDQPLNIKLPDSFAGVHVLAQYGGGGGSGAAGGIGQGAGGAFGGGGGGGGGGGAGGGLGGGGGGMFNVAPEKIGKVPYVSVCLEHGKPDPKSTMRYEVRPLDSFTTNPKVRETLMLLGRGAISQRVAQIVAWHSNNEMSWEVLAAKHVERLGGGSYPYFSADEMRAAMQVDKHITETLEAREKSPALPKL